MRLAFRSSGLLAPLVRAGPGWAGRWMLMLLSMQLSMLSLFVLQRSRQGVIRPGGYRPSPPLPSRSVPTCPVP